MGAWEPGVIETELQRFKPGRLQLQCCAVCGSRWWLSCGSPVAVALAGRPRQWARGISGCVRTRLGSCSSICLPVLWCSCVADGRACMPRPSAFHAQFFCCAYCARAAHLTRRDDLIRVSS
jgi:hypothetical protein